MSLASRTMPGARKAVKAHGLGWLIGMPPRHLGAVLAAAPRVTAPRVSPKRPSSEETAAIGPPILAGSPGRMWRAMRARGAGVLLGPSKLRARDAIALDRRGHRAEPRQAGLGEDCRPRAGPRPSGKRDEILRGLGSQLRGMAYIGRLLEGVRASASNFSRCSILTRRRVGCEIRNFGRMRSALQARRAVHATKG